MHPAGRGQAREGKEAGQGKDVHLRWWVENKQGCRGEIGDIKCGWGQGVCTGKERLKGEHWEGHTGRRVERNHWVITGFSITVLAHTVWGEMILKALETQWMGQVFGPQKRGCSCWVSSCNFSAKVVQKQLYYDDSTFFKFSWFYFKSGLG